MNTFDWIIFVILSIQVMYLFIFSILSHLSQKVDFKYSSKRARIAVLFPAYMEDSVILNTIESFSKQNYEKSNYRAIVIADKLKQDTILKLKTFDIDIISVDFKNSTKAKALNYAMKQLEGTNFEIVTILDADNIVEPDYLNHINQAYQNNCKAIQCHRKAKSCNTHVSVLDAVSEEINNSIFRKGHNIMGLSAALIGSGCAFDFMWFKENIKRVESVGEDKEIELLLSQQNIHVQYLDNVYVYDQKIETKGRFYNQRRRWQSAQLEVCMKGFRDITSVYKSVGLDFWNKIFQWLMLPRSILLLTILLYTTVVTIFIPEISIKWLCLSVVFILSLLLAVPNRLYNSKLFKAIPHVPILAMMMILNMFQLKIGNKQFIHTRH